MILGRGARIPRRTSILIESRPESSRNAVCRGNARRVFSMISPSTSRRTLRRAVTSLILIFGSAVLPAGCGESDVNTTNIPTDFAEKLEKEHPELFVKKSGRGKTEVVSGRDKKVIIRREWLKANGGGE
jgi:hypothetical protein